MLIAAIQYTPGTTLGITVAVTVAVFALGVLAQVWLGSKKRQLTYELTQNTRLLEMASQRPSQTPDRGPAKGTAPARQGEDLKVVLRGQALTDPRVLYIALVSRGRSDIERKDFDDGQPLRFDVGARIVAVLDKETMPAGVTMPDLRRDGRELQLWPSLIHKRQTVVIALLVDGATSAVTCDRRLANVDVLAQEHVDSMRNPRNLAIYLTWVAAGLGMVAWGLLGARPPALWWLVTFLVVAPITALNAHMMGKRHRHLRKAE